MNIRVFFSFFFCFCHFAGNTQVNNIPNYGLSGVINERIKSLQTSISTIVKKNPARLEGKIEEATKLFSDNAEIETVSLHNPDERDVYPNAKAYFDHLRNLIENVYDEINITFDTINVVKFMEEVSLENELEYSSEIKQYFIGRVKDGRSNYCDFTTKVLKIVAWRTDINSEWNIQFKGLKVKNVTKHENCNYP